jgi:hypothetical protein
LSLAVNKMVDRCRDLLLAQTMPTVGQG